VEQSYVWYVGIDWGSEAHDLVLVDGLGQVKGTWKIAHDAVAVHDCLTEILSQTGTTPDQVAVGLEIPRGVIVEALLERGFVVFALNPKQLDRFRDRHTIAGAKDDRRDAYVVADSLRTDRHRFRRVQPEPAALVELREYVQMLDVLARDYRRVANQLREQLVRVVPHWLALAPAADEPWFWRVIEDGLTSTGPRPVRASRVSRILREHRITRWSTEEVLAVLAQRQWTVAAGTWPAVYAHVMLLLPRLRLLRTQRSDLEATLDRALARCAETEGQPGEHRDVSILRSLPGVGRKVAAAMLGYATRALAERDYHTLRSYTGVAPVTKRSGKRYHVTTMRYACHPKLRAALHYWAGASLRLDGAAHAYYKALRQRGCTHGRALRSVGDRWLRILMAMLRTQQTYDPSRFETATT
jgi:transposase